MPNLNCPGIQHVGLGGYGPLVPALPRPELRIEAVSNGWVVRRPDGKVAVATDGAGLAALVAEWADRVPSGT